MFEIYLQTSFSSAMRQKTDMCLCAALNKQQVRLFPGAKHQYSIAAKLYC